MAISTYSIAMAVLWSSIATVFFHLIKRRKFIASYGVTSLIVIYSICVLRLLFPFEPPYVKIIGVEKYITVVYETIVLDEYGFGKIKFTILHILCVIWACGSLISYCCWRIRYRKLKKKLTHISKNSIPKGDKILSEIQKKYGGKIRVKIWQTAAVEIPIGIGVIRKVIFLPKEYYTDEELHDILLHEYTHLIHHDIEVKGFLQLFCCIFWWNPCAYILRNEIDELLEIRCDLATTNGMDKGAKVNYLQTIVNVLKHTEKDNHNTFPLASLFRFRQHDNFIVERFQLILDTHLRTPEKKIHSFLIGMMLCMVVILSYVVQFQAEFAPPECPEEQMMSPENVYFINNGDGTYLFVCPPKNIEQEVTIEEWLLEDLKSQNYCIKEKGEK